MTTNQSNRKSLTGLIEGATASSNLDITGNVNMKGFKLFNLGLGTDLQDSTNKTQLDAVVSDITIIDNSISIIEISLNSIGNNDASFQAIDASLVFLDSSAVQFSLGIASNVVDIANNTSNIATNTSNIATNTSNIATNTSNIATANSNIATNTSNITIIENSCNIYEASINAFDLTSVEASLNFLDLSGVQFSLAIASNTSNISTNTSNIATANSNISTNTSNIATNTSNIATNTSNIATNTSAISTANSNISTNTSNIATNTSAIATANGNISTNTSNIATNTSAIATANGNISTNTSNIATNTSAIATANGNISTNTSNIATNTSAIATANSNISTNTSNIATNTSAISTHTAEITALETSSNVFEISLNFLEASGVVFATDINNIETSCNVYEISINALETAGGGSLWTESATDPAIYITGKLVGIVNTTPQFNLDIQGDMRCSSTTSAGNYGFVAKSSGEILSYNTVGINSSVNRLELKQNSVLPAGSHPNPPYHTKLNISQYTRNTSYAAALLQSAVWAINVSNENGSYASWQNQSSILNLMNEGGSIVINAQTAGHQNNNYRIRCYGNAGGSSGWAIYSDNRIKYHEQNITGALATLNKLKAQKYEKITESLDYRGKWIPSDSEWDSVKNSYDSSGRRLYEYIEEIGFIAQDVRKINDLSFCVTGEEVNEEGDETTLMMNYNDIFALSIQGIQELDAKRREDNKKFIDLNKRIKILEDKMKNIEAETEKEYIL
jgi:hypothetical protein